MLDIRYLRQNIARVEERLTTRGQQIDLGPFVKLEGQRRNVLQEVETLRNQRNVVNRAIGEMKKKGEDFTSLTAEMGKVSDRIKGLEGEINRIEDELSVIMLTLPNLPHEAVTPGGGPEDNQVLKYWGEKPRLDFTPRPHWELGEDLDILDFARGSKITGARFTLLKGGAALLERALISFMLDLHTEEHGYHEVLPPFMVNRESMTATGQLPKFAEDLFRLENTEYFLIPTAEVPVTNIHRGEILAEADLPLSYAAYTPCFRAEAGSYGKDTRGLIRQHQFNKVELVKFTAPEQSDGELERLTDHAEEVLERLQLHYRRVSLCSGDLGFSAARTYDLEVWLPGQGTYREISSCSNFGDFQARRAGIRFRREKTGRVEHVHTLNGSGLAVGRTLVAILENYQRADGTIEVPEALKPYWRGKVPLISRPS